MQTWTATATAPDQIKQTVRTILLSEEFRTTWGEKVKRPNEVAFSFLRATNGTFAFTSEFDWRFRQTGYTLFRWPTPTGHPDTREYWLSTNVTMQRWRFVQDMMQSWFEATTFDLRPQMPPTVQTARQILDFWLDRVLGRGVSGTTYNTLLDFIRQGARDDDPPGSPDAPPDVRDDDDLTDRINSLVQLICMTPDFHMR